MRKRLITILIATMLLCSVPVNCFASSKSTKVKDYHYTWSGDYGTQVYRIDMNLGFDYSIKDNNSKKITRIFTDAYSPKHVDEIGESSFDFAKCRTYNNSTLLATYNLSSFTNFDVIYSVSEICYFHKQKNINHTIKNGNTYKLSYTCSYTPPSGFYYISGPGRIYDVAYSARV